MVTKTPEEWRAHLDARLEKRRPRIQAYEAYYCGDHPLAFATSKFREAFGRLFSAFADNWMQIVVDTSVDRLTVTGFDFGDTTINRQANDIWQANGLDSEALIAHTEAVKTGTAYALVDQTDNGPLITIEHPSQMVVATDPANRRVRLAAYKKWCGEDDYLYCNVYLPDSVHKWKSDQPRAKHNTLDANHIKWNVLVDSEPNPLGVVPVVPLENNPSLLEGGRSDLEVVMPIQDMLNKTLSDMLVASEFQAFRQRVLTGVEIPKYPDDHVLAGQPVKDFDMRTAMSRLWTFEDENARVTELGQVDLSSYTNAVEMAIRHIAALTRTPPHYLLGQMTNISSDALVAAETGLVNKVKRKMLSFGQAWEDVITLALLADNVKTDARGRAVWMDPESKGVAQTADAAVKALNAGVPYEVVWSKFFDATPDEVTQWLAMKRLPQGTVLPVGQSESSNGSDSNA